MGRLKQRILRADNGNEIKTKYNARTKHYYKGDNQFSIKSHETRTHEKCEYCKIRGHTAIDCRKLRKRIEIRDSVELENILNEMRNEVVTEVKSEKKF